MTDALNLVPWGRLSPERQGALRADFIRCYAPQAVAALPAGGPPTASPYEERLTQFAVWLAARGVAVSDTDLRRIRWDGDGDTGLSREAMG